MTHSSESGPQRSRSHRDHHDHRAACRGRGSSGSGRRGRAPSARSRRSRAASPSASRRRAPRTRRRSGSRRGGRRRRRAGTRSARVYVSPLPLSRTVAVTPSSSCASSSSSWLKRIRPGESRSAPALRIGSRRICGRLSWRHGLAARQFSFSPPAPQDSSLAIRRPVVRVVPGEARVVRGGRHLLGRRAALGDLVGDAAVLEDLHRPLVEDVGLRQVRRPRPRADQQVLDAVAGEQHRRGESGAATADDQNWDVFLGHLLLLGFASC